MITPYKSSPHVEGDFLLLKCLPDGGNPQFFTYSWTLERSGNNSTNTTPLQLPSPHPDGHYLVDHVTSEDAGIYRCIAHNHGGDASGEIDVKIMCKYETSAEIKC